MTATEPKHSERESSAHSPVCRKPALKAHRPFCSKRCAEVDLGRWLKGGYAVPGEPAGEAGDVVSDLLGGNLGEDGS